MQDRVIDNNTISGIVGNITEPTKTKTNRTLSQPEIIDMYESFEAEGLYDVDDISTRICEVLVTEMEENISDPTENISDPTEYYNVKIGDANFKLMMYSILIVKESVDLEITQLTPEGLLIALK